MSSLPTETYNLSVSFNCNPNKVDDLLAIVYAELEKMKSELDLDELAEVKSNYVKQVSESQRDNRYWLNNISTNLELDQPVSSEVESIDRMKAITSKELKETVKMITKNPAIVEGLLMPQE